MYPRHENVAPSPRLNYTSRSPSTSLQAAPIQNASSIELSSLLIQNESQPNQAVTPNAIANSVTSAAGSASQISTIYRAALITPALTKNWNSSYTNANTVSTKTTSLPISATSSRSKHPLFQSRLLEDANTRGAISETQVEHSDDTFALEKAVENLQGEAARAQDVVTISSTRERTLTIPKPSSTLELANGDVLTSMKTATKMPKRTSTIVVWTTATITKTVPYLKAMTDRTNSQSAVMTTTKADMNSLHDDRKPVLTSTSQSGSSSDKARISSPNTPATMSSSRAGVASQASISSPVISSLLSSVGANSTQPAGNATTSMMPASSSATDTAGVPSLTPTKLGIIGGSVGLTLFIAIMAVICFCVSPRRQKKRDGKVGHDIHMNNMDSATYGRPYESSSYTPRPQQCKGPDHPFIGAGKELGPSDPTNSEYNAVRGRPLAYESIAAKDFSRQDPQRESVSTMDTLEPTDSASMVDFGAKSRARRDKLQQTMPTVREGQELEAMRDQPDPYRYHHSIVGSAHGEGSRSEPQQLREARIVRQPMDNFSSASQQDWVETAANKLSATNSRRRDDRYQSVAETRLTEDENPVYRPGGPKYGF